MSLGPIRELSAGPKPGRVSTFTKRLKEGAKEARKRRREGGWEMEKTVKWKKRISYAFTTWALSQQSLRATYSEWKRTIIEHRLTYY